jgi:glycosyltransferase involved in cell wall biosynthesis
MPRTVHLWTPGLFDFKGGIQVYSGFLLEALQNSVPQTHYDVFSLHDRPPTSSSNTQAHLLNSRSSVSKNVQLHYSGFFPRSVRIPCFASQVFSAGLWHRPDLVIATHLNFTIAAHQLKQLTGIPYWTVAHGFEAWDIQRPALQKALANADRILAVSHYTRDRLLQEQSLDPAKVDVLSNTFDAQRFRVAAKPEQLLQQYGLTADQPIILTVNRLAAGESFHSYDQILAALPTIRQACPTAHYMIVGKGDDRLRLEQYIAEHQLQDCVTLAGFISDEELPDYYNLCDVFAMPSKLEGFGIVYLEAMASGKPVVGGYDGAMDALQGGQLGALVNPDDVNAIAQTLIQILQGTHPNPLLYQPLALREAAIQAFGFDRFQQNVFNLLEQFSTP